VWGSSEKPTAPFVPFLPALARPFVWSLSERDGLGRDAELERDTRRRRSSLPLVVLIDARGARPLVHQTMETATTTTTRRPRKQNMMMCSTVRKVPSTGAVVVVASPAAALLPFPAVPASPPPGFAAGGV